MLWLTVFNWLTDTYWWLSMCCVIQFSSVTQSCLLFETPWTAACQASLSITSSRSLLRFMSIESVMPPNHLMLCCPLLLLASSGSFPMSWLFKSGGQSFGASASASVFPMNIQSWFPLGLTGLILLSKGYQRYKRDYITNANNERLFRVTKIPTVFFIKMYVDRV